MPWGKSDVIPMRWSLILSRTGSMSSWVRFLDPTRPFSIPNIPPKPPFLALQRNHTECRFYINCRCSKFRWRNSTFEACWKDKKVVSLLPFLSVCHHNSLLFLHYFILLIWGLIIDTSQVPFHWIHLDQLKEQSYLIISSAITILSKSFKQPQILKHLQHWNYNEFLLAVLACKKNLWICDFYSGVIMDCSPVQLWHQGLGSVRHWSRCHWFHCSPALQCSSRPYPTPGSSSPLASGV